MELSKETSRTTTFEALLGILTLGPMTGYEIRQRTELSIGNFWSESFGQIYPALTRLHKRGLVHVEASGKAGRRVYSLTPAGRRELKAWLKVMPQPRRTRNEVLLKLFFGGNSNPETVRGQIEATRARYVEELARYGELEGLIRQRQGGKPGLPYFLMTLNYGVMEARMVLTWADETLAELDRLVEEAKAVEAC